MFVALRCELRFNLCVSNKEVMGMAADNGFASSLDVTDAVEAAYQRCLDEQRRAEEQARAIATEEIVRLRSLLKDKDLFFESDARTERLLDRREALGSAWACPYTRNTYDLVSLCEIVERLDTTDDCVENARLVFDSNDVALSFESYDEGERVHVNASVPRVLFGMDEEHIDALCNDVRARAIADIDASIAKDGFLSGPLRDENARLLEENADLRAQVHTLQARIAALSGEQRATTPEEQRVALSEEDAAVPDRFGSQEKKTFINDNLLLHARYYGEALPNPLWVSDSVGVVFVDGGDAMLISPDGTGEVNLDDPDEKARFELVRSGKQVLVDEDSKVALVGDASDLFRDCRKLEHVDASRFDVSRVTDMSDMFLNCKSLTSLDVSDWDTSLVTDTRGMFCGCESLTSLDMSGCDVSHVTDMRSMFSGCRSLVELDASGWDTGAVRNMSGMFWCCESLRTLDASKWDTHNVEDLFGMFRRCLSLTELDVTNWDTSAVKNMSGMFDDCESLTTLDVSRWNTSNVENMEGIFAHCYMLEPPDISSWNFDKVRLCAFMFDYCGRDRESSQSACDSEDVMVDERRVPCVPDEETAASDGLSF
jgi:surface protein